MTVVRRSLDQRGLGAFLTGGISRVRIGNKPKEKVRGRRK